MKIQWIKLARYQRQVLYKGWTASITPIGNKMYHYDIFDENGKPQYAEDIKGFCKAKRTVRILLKGQGDYLY